MCECARQLPNMPQRLGGVFDAVDPSVQNVFISTPNLNESPALPVTDQGITLDDLMGFATLFQIARFLSDL